MFYMIKMTTEMSAKTTTSEGAISNVKLRFTFGCTQIIHPYYFGDMIHGHV